MKRLLGGFCSRLRVHGSAALLAGVLGAGVLSSGPALATGRLTSPDPLLWDISCPSTALCVAIDDKGHAVISTDPTTATPTWSDSETGLQNPIAISCSSTALCVAVDSNGHVAISTNPTAATPTWSTAPIGAPHSFTNGISCPLTSLCVAVNYEGNAVVSTDPATVAPTWSPAPIISIPPEENFQDRLRLSAVSCTSTALCVATDNKGDAVISTNPTAATWSAPESIDSAALTGISCPSTSLCVAVDYAGRAVISTDPASTTPTWSAPESIDNTYLTGISCPSTSLCVAVDSVGRAVISTDPTAAMPTWLAPPALSYYEFAESPASVSCASVSLCAIAFIEKVMISTNPTAANPTWSAPSTIDTVPTGTLSLLGSPTPSGPTLTFRVSCSGEDIEKVFGLFADGALQGCPGSATLTTTERLAANGHTITGVTAAAKRKRLRTVVIGRTTLTKLFVEAYAGVVQSYTIKIKLNSTGKRLLTKFKRLPARLSVTAAVPELRVPPKTMIVKTVRVTFKAKTMSRPKH